MIKLITDHPLALDSDDHHYPDGVHLDNHFNMNFVNSVENVYKQKINILDLGCAGGAFVSGMLGRGHLSVGLEGSDHCINLKPEVIAKLGQLPYGYQNWQVYYNKNLFTCDITYEYQLVNNGTPMQFDLITCFDVMEHFYEERIGTFLDMVVRHLKPNGIFVASIAMFHLVKDKILEEGQVEYHKSLFSHEKWLTMLAPYLKQVPYPFECDNRGRLPVTDQWYLTYAGTKL